MKGTLLLLALLVTRELGFQKNKTIMHTVISQFNPTAEERAAFDKILECYNELGLKGKAMDASLMEAINFSPECREYYTKEIIEKF
ncbi:secretoglobin family 2B member 2 [Cricetulus griseus]|uniref:Secretoglobin family 2B member 2 n=1 Tax=Cricetulus griseus TaxID=10029 RepID=A0A9J7H7W2_CRIGR|nr:secretoglobin family 2B member 2 [Cricetulus griseus]XP_035305364.1 secretoglobin family 2B member 2 [Cricetulus griseus]